MYQMGVHTRLRTKRLLLNDTIRSSSLSSVKLCHWLTGFWRWEGKFWSLLQASKC